MCIHNLADCDDDEVKIVVGGTTPKETKD